MRGSIGIVGGVVQGYIGVYGEISLREAPVIGRACPEFWHVGI